jgi:hypothetical protein
MLSELTGQFHYFTVGPAMEKSLCGRPLRAVEVEHLL